MVKDKKEKLQVKVEEVKEKIRIPEVPSIPSLTSIFSKEDVASDNEKTSGSDNCFAEPSTENVEEIESKTLPKIRLRVEEEASKAKQFATAQGLSMHMKVVKAKKVGLTALHKVATWLAPKKK